MFKTYSRLVTEVAEVAVVTRENILDLAEMFGGEIRSVGGSLMLIAGPWSFKVGDFIGRRDTGNGTFTVTPSPDLDYWEEDDV